MTLLVCGQSPNGRAVGGQGALEEKHDTRWWHRYEHYVVIVWPDSSSGASIISLDLNHKTATTTVLEAVQHKGCNSVVIGRPTSSHLAKNYRCYVNMYNASHSLLIG